MASSPKRSYLPEFWSIASDALPLVLGSLHSDDGSLTKAAIASTIIAIHLWAAALSGNPAIPDYPTGSEMQELWIHHRVLLWEVAVEAHVARIADGDVDLLDPETPDGRAVRILISAWLQARWVQIDWELLADAVEDGCGYVWYGSRFMMLRAAMRGESLEAEGD